MYKCVLIKKAGTPHIKGVFAFFDEVIFGHRPLLEDLDQEDEALGPGVQSEADAIMAALDAITDEADDLGVELLTPISSVSGHARPVSMLESMPTPNLAESISNIAPRSHRSPSPESKVPQSPTTTISASIEIASVRIQLDATTSSLAPATEAVVKQKPIPKPSGKKPGTKAQRNAAAKMVLGEGARSAIEEQPRVRPVRNVTKKPQAKA